jgi:hypothetical protein
VREDEPRQRPWALWFVLGGIVVAVGLAIVLAGELATSDHTVDHPQVDPLTADGYAMFLADLQSGPGADHVRSLTMDQHSAQVGIATGSGDATSTYHWDGSLGTEPTTGHDSATPFDLGALAVNDWTTRCAEAGRLLGRPTDDCTVSVTADRHRQRDWIAVTARAASGAQATIYYGRDGSRSGQRVTR